MGVGSSLVGSRMGMGVMERKGVNRNGVEGRVRVG
jgi:hypothetical protein